MKNLLLVEVKINLQKLEDKYESQKKKILKQFARDVCPLIKRKGGQLFINLKLDSNDKDLIENQKTRRLVGGGSFFGEMKHRRNSNFAKDVAFSPIGFRRYSNLV